MFQLLLGHLPGKVPFEGKGTPGTIVRDVLSAHFDEQQLRHQGQSYGAFDPLGVFGDLGLPQADHPFDLFYEEFHRPPPGVEGDPITAGDMRQSGHDDDRCGRPIVTPLFTQDNRDVSTMTEAGVFEVDPIDPAAAVRAGDPGSVVARSWQMLPHITPGSVIATLPGARQTHDEKVAAFLDQGERLLGGERRIGQDEHLGGPGGPAEAAQHGAPQGMG